MLYSAAEHPERKIIRKEISYVGKAFLLHLALTLLFSIITGIIAAIFFPQLITDDGLDPTMMISVSAIITIIAEFIPFMLCAQKTKIHIKEFFVKPQIPADEIIKYTILAVGVCSLASIATSSFSLLLENIGLTLTTPDFSYSSNIFYNLILLLTTIIIAPIFEEFMLRGVALKVFSRYGSRFAILSTALLFALIHGNLLQGIPMFFFGSLLAIITLKSQSLYPAIFIHFVNNALAMVMSVDNSFLQFIFVILAIVLIGSAVYLFLKKAVDLNTDSIPEVKGIWKQFFTCFPIIFVILLFSLLTLASIVIA